MNSRRRTSVAASHAAERREVDDAAGQQKDVQRLERHEPRSQSAVVAPVTATCRTMKTGRKRKRNVDSVRSTAALMLDRAAEKNNGGAVDVLALLAGLGDAICWSRRNPSEAGVVKLADARDSKSRGVYAPCGFDSLLRHFCASDKPTGRQRPHLPRNHLLRKPSPSKVIH